MTERSSRPGVASEGSPPWIVLNFDDVGAQVSEVLSSGTVVLLLSGARDRGWAANAALQLARSWAAGGRRVVLADLHLEKPLLRGQPSGPELEGMVDIFLYGASLSRIATPGPDGAYYVIPAGTYTSDTSEIFRHPRWKKLVAGFRDTQATLLLFLPIESKGLTELSAWSSEAILLGSAGESDLAPQLGAGGIKVLAAIKGNGAGPGYGEQGLAGGDLAVAAGVRRGTIPSSATPEDATDLPPPATRRRLDKRAPHLLLFGLLALVVLGAIFYVIATLRPEILPASLRPPPEAASVNAAPGALASREGEVLPYSIHVKAFPSLVAAREQLLIEERRFESTVFFISPEEIQGIVYYKILAGLATDTASATRLRDRLVREGAIAAEDVVGTWSLLQDTPLAFDLGEFETREAAVARADSLLLRNIPSYAVAVPYSDGSTRWQLYGGAYRDSFHASRMDSLLTAAGMPAQITLRAGAPVTISQ